MWPGTRGTPDARLKGMQPSLTASGALLVVALVGCTGHDHAGAQVTSLDPAAVLPPTAAVGSACLPASPGAPTTSPGAVLPSRPYDPDRELGLTSMQGPSDTSTENDYSRPPQRERSGSRLS